MSPAFHGILPDLARAPGVVAARGGSLGHPMHLLATTTSTNDEAKRAARQGAPHGATWVAEHQTAGRGRQGRAWLSPAGEGLLFSVLLRDAPEGSRLPLIALVAGLAVRDAVARALRKVSTKIKWPNDVEVEGKKVAGVLVEAITTGSRVEAVVIGVGINVHTRVFPQEIAQRATSIGLVACVPAGVPSPRDGPQTLPSQPDPPDRATILCDTLASLDADLHVVTAHGLGFVRARLEAADALRHLRVRNDAGDEGVASGIDDEGRLMVRRDDGALARWVAGEVHLV